MPFWPYLFHEHSGHVVPGSSSSTDLMTEAGSARLRCGHPGHLGRLRRQRADLGTGVRADDGRRPPRARPALDPRAVTGDGRADAVVVGLGVGAPDPDQPGPDGRGGVPVDRIAPSSRPGVVRPGLRAGAVLLAEGRPPDRAGGLRTPCSRRGVAAASGCGGSCPPLPRSSPSRSPTSPCSATSRSAPGELRHRAHRRGDVAPRGRERLRPRVRGHVPAGTPRRAVGKHADRPLPLQLSAPTVTTIVLVVCALGLAWVAVRKPRTVWLLLLPLTYTVLSLGSCSSARAPKISGTSWRSSATSSIRSSSPC